MGATPSKVPGLTSFSFPLWRTAIWSASLMVLSLWAMISTVRPAGGLRSALQVGEAVSGLIKIDTAGGGGGGLR